MFKERARLQCGRALLAILAVLMSALPGHATEPIDGRWEGTLTFREAVWSIRMEFEHAEGELSATLDLPDMVMVGNTLTVVPGEGSALRVQLPFGIGEFDLEPADGMIRTSRALGEETMALELARSGPAPYTQEEVRIESRGAQLAGTLVLPSGRGPWPGVVLVHGSAIGDRTHSEYRSWADFYARRGVATLMYDRRGQGASTGSGDDDRGFKLLATDARAAVAFLCAREEVDATRVGLTGGSQAGWIVPLAAVDNEQVSFLILHSSPAVTPAEQELQSTVVSMRADGLDESEIQHALAYLRLYFYVAHSGEGWPTLQQAMRSGADQRWFESVDQPEKLEDMRWWSRHHGVDPATSLPLLAVPVLAFYGERDTVVPPNQNEALLRQYLAPLGSDLTVVRLPRADHRLETPLGRDDHERWHWPRISEELFATTGAWLETNVTHP